MATKVGRKVKNPARKLTADFVKAVAEDGIYQDTRCPGFVLKVRNGGNAKSYFLRYSLRKNRNEIGLGGTMDISLDAARNKAVAIREKMRQTSLDGVAYDPAEAKKKEREEKRIGNVRVSQVLKEYWDKHVEPKPNPKIRRKKEPTIYKKARHDAILGEFIGYYQLIRVTPAVIIEKTDIGAKWDTAHKEADARLLYAQAVFRYAAAKYGLKSNPADKDFLIQTGMLADHDYTSAPRRGVPLEHAARFMKAIRESEDNSYRDTGRLTTSLWMEMVMLTGVRPVELRKARWKEFDDRKGYMVWNSPHRKTERFWNGHTVPRPITGPMLAVLNEMRDRRNKDQRYNIQSEDDLVFPSPPPEKKNKLFGETALRTYINSLKFEIDGVIYDGKTPATTIHPHGARETLDTFYVKHKYPKHVLKVQLDHMHDNAMDDVYGWRRRSSVDPAIEERRDYMEHWGRFLNGVGPAPHSATVTELITRRRASR
jgi:integrase